MITRSTQSKCLGRPGRAKGLKSATLIVAILAATAAQASTISGMVDTSTSPTNGSGDPLRFAGAALTGPFPSSMTVGEFDFSVPSGQAITAGSFSGGFGSDVLQSGTSQAKLFVDGVQLALCDVTCEAQSQSSVVSWLYSLTASDLTQLSSNSLWQAGRAVITASQLSVSQVVLDPTNINLTLAPVPVPPAFFLFASALAPFFGFARRKARAVPA
jgi:hypothetical protein